MTTISTQSVAAREGARHQDGKFGTQVREDNVLDLMSNGFPENAALTFDPADVDRLDVSTPVRDAILAYHDLSESERVFYDPLHDRELFDWNAVDKIANGKGERVYRRLLDAEAGVDFRATQVSWSVAPDLSPVDREDFVNYVLGSVRQERYGSADEPTESDIKKRIAARLDEIGPVYQSAYAKLSEKDRAKMLDEIYFNGFDKSDFDPSDILLRWRDVARVADRDFTYGGDVTIKDAQAYIKIEGRSITLDFPGERQYRLESEIEVDTDTVWHR